MEPKPAPFIEKYWEVLALVGISAFLVLVTALGIVVVQVGSAFTLTGYGALLLTRKGLQWDYAIQNNRRMMTVVREPLTDELIKLYPQLEEELRELGKLNKPFDVYRRHVLELTGMTDERWLTFVEASFRGAIPRVSMLAPIYKTPIYEIEKLARSVDGLSYPVYSMVFVVNSAIDYAMIDHLRRLLPVLSRRHRTKFRLIVEAKRGKRHAMYRGFRRAISDHAKYVINVDSDTYLDVDAVTNAVRVFEVNPEYVCLTANVTVDNKNVNRLTMLTYLRYWNAFNIERAAQSLFGQMTVPSGPFLAMQVDKLRLILDEWHEQEFLGVECTYGDDRHVGTLCIIRGWLCVYSPESLVYTDAPTDYAVWQKQQLRWSKSAVRENLVLVGRQGLKNLNWFVRFDLVYLTVFPFLLVAIIVSVLWRSIEVSYGNGPVAGFLVLLPYLITILVVNFVFNSLYGLKLTGDKVFLWSPAYMYLWLRYLVLLKIKAIVRLRDPSWGTK